MSCGFQNPTFRQIFTDGRPLPEDPLPTWMGYAIGRWDRDVFVVTTSGVTDRRWLDVNGHPHTEALLMTERFRRVDLGHMEVEVTHTDLGTFKAPLTITQHLRYCPTRRSSSRSAPTTRRTGRTVVVTQ